MAINTESGLLQSATAANRRVWSLPRLGVNQKIDVCRGLLAALVVIAHSWELAWSLHPTELSALTPATKQIIGNTVGSGLCWVMGFFVISGYCIHLSVERLINAGQFPVQYYVLARLTRIFPLYYLALLFTVFAEWQVGSARPSLWPNGRSPLVLLGQVFAVQGVSETFGSFAPSWSITYELAYYLLYGLLAWNAKGRASYPLRLGIVTSLVIASTCDVYYFGVHKSLVVMRLGLVFGMGLTWFLGAWISAYRERLARSAAIQAFGRTWPIFLALGLVFRCINNGLQFSFLFSGLAFGLLLVRFLGDERSGGSKEESPWVEKRCQELGLSSYPMYLFHGPVILLVGALLTRFGLLVDWRLTWTIASLSGILFGVILGFVLERPFMAWRSALLRRWRSR